MALATVVAALAVAPTARGQNVNWLGGARDYWYTSAILSGNFDGPNGALTDVPQIYFGANHRDDNGTVILNDHQDTFRSMNFSNGNWLLTGYGDHGLTGDAYARINVAATAPVVRIEVPLTMASSNDGSNYSFDLYPDAGTLLDLAGRVRDNPLVQGGGPLYKYGAGTVYLRDHNYRGGTFVNEGTLYDFKPDGNYSNNAETIFQIDTNQSLAGNLSGAGTLRKDGFGALTLTGLTTMTRPLEVFRGRLIVQNPGSGLYKNDSVLEFATTGDKTYSGTVTGTRGLIKSGTGSLLRTGTSSYAGETSITGGRLIDVNPRGAYQTYDASAAFEIRNASAMAFGGAISGVGSFTKSGAGTLTLSGGLDTHTGGTTVTAGRLIDATPHGNYVVGGGASMEVPVDSALTLSGFISGAGTFVKSGYGQLALTGGNARDTTLRVANGTMTVAGLSLGKFIVDDGELEILTTGSQASYALISGEGFVRKSGAGTIAQYEPMTHLSGTIIEGGRFVSAVDFALPARGAVVVGTNGTLEIGRNIYQPIRTLEGGGSVVLNTGSELETAFNSSFATHTGVISGAGTFNKTGTGTQTLTGLNTYTGGTNVLQGRLVVNLPNGNYDTYSGGALEFAPGDNRTYAGNVTGLGSLIKSGDGTLTLSGTNSYTGGTVVNGGRLIDKNPRGTYVVNRSDLELAVINNLQNLPAITGTGNVTKSGFGTWYVNGAHTYEGATTIASGTVITLANNALPTGTALTVGGSSRLLGSTGIAQTVGSLAGTGRVEMPGGLTVNGSGSSLFSGTIEGSGAFVKAGTGTLSLTGANTYTGETKVNAGRLIDANPHGAYTVDSAGALEFRTATAQSFGGTVVGTGSLTKTGAGTLTFTTRPNVSQLTIAEGTLKGTAALLNRDIASTGGTLQFDQVTSGLYNSEFTGSGSILKTGAGNLRMSFPLAHSGGVRVSAGQMTLAGGSFGGGLTVDAAGTLVQDSGTVLMVGGPSDIQGRITTAAGSTTAFSGPVSGAGNFAGPGTVRLGSSYSPGNSPASVTFSGDMVLAMGSSLKMELGGTSPGTGYDKLSVLGLATLSGALDVIWYGGFTASAGQSFDLFDLTNTSGAFTSVNLPSLSDGLVWNTSALYTTGAISVAPVPEPASMAVLGLGLAALKRRRRA